MDDDLSLPHEPRLDSTRDTLFFTLGDSVRTKVFRVSKRSDKFTILDLKRSESQTSYEVLVAIIFQEWIGLLASGLLRL